jgi:GcrA cell cycle regulator
VPALKSWTKEDDEILTREWTEGMDTRQIALLLAVSRTKNAIIGRAHRLGLPLHSRAHARGKRPTKEKKACVLFTPVSSTKPIAIESYSGIVNGHGELPKDPPIVHLGVDDLGNEWVSWPATTERDNDNGCRWPVGDRPLEEDFYCGLPKKMNCSYCVDHARIAYRPLQQGNSGHAFVLRYIRG